MKSQNIPFYRDLLVSSYLDMVSAILPQTEIDRDVETIRRRADHEGLRFLTVTLPQLGKSIDVSLANGTALEAHQFARKDETNLPKFMGGLLRMVFRDDGVPWFATWHSDAFPFKRQMKAPGGMDSPEGERWMHSVALAAGRSIPFIQRLRSLEVSVIPETFPGLQWLGEVGFSRDEIDHISLGLMQGPIPLLSDEERSARRETAAVALRAIRQVCYAFYKLNIPHTDEQESRVLEDFVRVDAELRFDASQAPTEDQAIIKEARHIICRVLANADPDSGIPRHGPGAVATGEKSSEKHVFGRYYTRLHSRYSFDKWFHCNVSHTCDSIQELQALDTLEYGTAKVVLVPKDSRGPRLISCEPLEYQWIQQAQMAVLVDTIQSHPLSRGRINFTDQTINRKLALQGSLDFDLATLDMKEASDRVSLNLVKALFNDTWFEALYASRTPQTQLPDGRVVQFRKFAPMGSAVCFPVEALVFWALCVGSLMCTQNLPLRIAATKVYVYGDDIIVDAAYHGVIRQQLPKFGLMLNDQKCCIAGPFKESCGMDAYFGHPVTPLKYSAVWSYHLSPETLASYVEYSNECYRRGLFKTAELLERCIDGVLSTHGRAPIPVVSDREPSCLAYRRDALAILENRRRGVRSRLNHDTHTYQVQGYRLQSQSEMTTHWGWPLLLRILAEKERRDRFKDLADSKVDQDPPPSATLTGTYPIAHRVKLKRAWTNIA